MKYSDYLGIMLPTHSNHTDSAEVNGIINSQKGSANGLASLDNNGKV